jgi:hypothetical protein
VLGLDRTLRPLIVPEPGFGIGEVDLSQIEVGIAAAVYGDDQLVEMFNTGDVYSEMAKLFYREELPEVDRDLPGQRFKKQYAAYRDIMKTCTLGIIYGMTPQWTINIDEPSASCNPDFGYRQVLPRAGPLNVQPLAEEVAAAIIEGCQDNRVKWLDGGKVQVRVNECIPPATRRTDEGRRRRFRRALHERLAGSGWVEVEGRPHVYQRQ